MADDYKYHIDHHGSLVRPPALAADPRAAVVAVAQTQRRLSMSAVGDGQFRRAHFESVVCEHVSGFGSFPGPGPAPLADAAGIPAVRRRAVTGPLSASGRLAHDEVAPVLGTVDRPVFAALPSPGYLAALGSVLATTADLDAVIANGSALAAIIRDEIAALAADGVAYVALGNPLYPPLLTADGRAGLASAGVDVGAVLAALIAADRAVFEGLAVPETFRVGLDLTDSGPIPATSAGYDRAAVDALLDEIPFHRLCVDFPAAPERRLPLDQVKPGLVISLGVVDVSVPEPEPVDALLALVDPVVEERTEDDVAIAANGGFAQSADRPLMTEAQQWEKLRLVEMVARYYWGNEI